jgi:hypothetical protein
MHAGDFQRRLLLYFYTQAHTHTPTHAHVDKDPQEAAVWCAGATRKLLSVLAGYALG